MKLLLISVCFHMPICIFVVLCVFHLAGDLITLEGAGAYNAAMHCASVSASRRGGRRQGNKTSHNRTVSSMAAIGSEPAYRPASHTRSRSAGSASEHSSSGSLEDIPAHVMEATDREERRSALDDNESHDDSDMSIPSRDMTDDELYGQMPLKRRLRALGKRMMRSLRINNTVP